MYKILCHEERRTSGYVSGEWTEAEAKTLAVAMGQLMPWRFSYSIEPIEDDQEAT